jgi:DNA-directed RNA polymerase subunit M/transcription elongation factor TFIIS
VDEDDFKDRPRKKRPKKEKFEKLVKSSWELNLKKSVLYRVLREPEDFLLKSKAAKDLGIDIVSVGTALASIEKDGIVVYKTVDPNLYPTFDIDINNRPWNFRSKISWFIDKWVWGDVPVFKHKGGFGRRKTRDHRQIRSKKQLTERLRNNPPEPVDWDGKAYFIIRGPEFVKACKKAQVPVNPTEDWTCPKCNKGKISYYTDTCHSGSCGYKRLPYEWPLPIEMKECKICGHRSPVGDKSHTVSNCNMIIINEVMDK